MTPDDILKQLEQVSPDTEEAVELSSMLIFEELGWNLSYAGDEGDGDTGFLGRTHQGEVVLKRYLKSSLLNLNPDLPKEAIKQVVGSLSRDRSTMSITHANLEVMKMLKMGLELISEIRKVIRFMKM